MLDEHELASERWLRRLALGASVVFLLLFLYIALRRMVYPFQMERVEDAMMTSVWRLRHGYPLYGPPSLEWAPFLYAPLFFYLSAALSHVMGLGYAPLRMVSILSTLGSFGVIYALVWKETRRWTAALVAVGLYASLYAIVLGWFDLGRVDSLSIFLFLAALYATRRMHPLVAALLWLLAFEAKQTYLPLGVAMFLIEWARPRRMLTGMVAFLAMAWASTAWLNHVTQHWYGYYAFGTTGEISWLPWRLAILSLPMYLLETLPIAVALILVAVLASPQRWRERDGSFYGIVTVVLGGAMWFVCAHKGANINAVIPFFAWVTILAGVALHRLLECYGGVQGMGRGRISAVAMLWLAVCLQLAMHLYHPSQLLGVIKDGPMRQQFRDRLRATPGDVWVVNHSYDALMAGKPMHPDMYAYDAVLSKPYAPAVQEFRQAMQRGQFTAVVSDYSPAEIGDNDVLTTPPFSAAYPLVTVLGDGSAGGSGTDKPAYLFLPCAALTSPPVGLVDAQHGFMDRSRCP